MRRIAITGMGITSCLGNDLDTVSRSLREGRSGIRTLQDSVDRGLRSQVGGAVELDLDAVIDRKLKRFMSDAAAYSYVALRDAIAQAGLSEDLVSHPRTGLIAGSGGGSSVADCWPRRPRRPGAGWNGAGRWRRTAPGTSASPTARCSTSRAW